MRRFLITPEQGKPFMVDAESVEQAMEESDWDVIAIHECDIFDILANKPAHNGLDKVE